MKQGDLFENYGARPDPQPSHEERARADLNEALRELRTADSFPWSEHALRVWRCLFRQMPNWLPEQERAEVQQAFLDELDRWGRRDE